MWVPSTSGFHLKTQSTIKCWLVNIILEEIALNYQVVLNVRETFILSFAALIFTVGEKNNSIDINCCNGAEFKSTKGDVGLLIIEQVS